MVVVATCLCTSTHRWTDQGHSCSKHNTHPVLTEVFSLKCLAFGLEIEISCGVCMHMACEVMKMCMCGCGVRQAKLDLARVHA